jgi:hypothetical protein
MMNTKRHFKIFTMASLVWGIFWLIGLPRYYQQYSFYFMLIFDLALVFPLALLIYSVLKKERTNKINLAFWLAFYFTVPFLIYDYLYCGFYLNHGISFINKYWYLSIYYIIPWLLCLPIGMQMEKQNRLHRLTRH